VGHFVFLAGKKTEQQVKKANTDLVLTLAKLFL